MVGCTVVAMTKRQTTTTNASVKVFDINVTRAAHMADVSTETIKRWARSGRIDARKNTSGNWVFNADDVRAMQNRNIVVEAL